MFIFSAFLWNHRGSIWLSYLLHEENDPQVIYGTPTTRRCPSWSSILLQSGQVCHRSVLASVRWTPQGRKCRAGTPYRYVIIFLSYLLFFIPWFQLFWHFHWVRDFPFLYGIILIFFIWGCEFALLLSCEKSIAGLVYPVMICT